MSESATCRECGMCVAAGEYHPYLACLAFKQCRDGNAVRANLVAVQAQAKQEERDAFVYLDKFKGVTFSIGERDSETDQYPIYYRTPQTHCGAIADFYSKDMADWFANLLNTAIRQREGA